MLNYSDERYENYPANDIETPTNGANIHNNNDEI